MGCVLGGSPATIIRLTYQPGSATARVLPSHELTSLMRNPLLRSAGVLSGVFYSGVVVTEADTDRSFYQEINERLRETSKDDGIQACLFLNAQNKQTVHVIIRPLRALGIPAAAIVDFDIFNDGGSNWRNFLEAGGVPEIERHALSQSRALIEQRISALGGDMKKGGVNLLAAGDREAAVNVISRLGEYGLFVVPHGELESWLATLGVKGPKDRWLPTIFERMGSDPSANDYLRPSANDVWHFVRQIKTWITDPQRKGMPA